MSHSDEHVALSNKCSAPTSTAPARKAMLVLEYDEDEQSNSAAHENIGENSVSTANKEEAMDGSDVDSVDTEPLSKEELDTMLGELERQYAAKAQSQQGEIFYGDDIIPPSSPTTLQHPASPSPTQVEIFDLVVDPSDLSVKYTDKWDTDHVKLACSPMNTYRKVSNQSVNLPKWELIERVLSANITSSKELEEAILSYNPSFQGQWDFAGLHYFINKVLMDDERAQFFEVILPTIKSLALQLPVLIKKPIPLLPKFVNREIWLSQHQIACLLANAFFCTFPRRSSRAVGEYQNCPSINFNTLYTMPCDKRKQGKLRCILHYFQRLSKSIPTGVVSFKRQVLEEFPNWKASDDKLSQMTVHPTGTIEDDGIGCIQIDFANKRLGGGVLGEGCVQEEIRFVINPELIVTRLFTEELEANEAVIIYGVERFSMYSGYGSTFAFAGDYVDSTPRDEHNRIRTIIAAIDAINFRYPAAQYREDFVIRELNKAYCGFYQSDTSVNLLPIATGNWGCGAFGGHRELKSLIQLMAASVLHKPLRYYTFGEREFATKLEDMYNFLLEKEITVGQLMRAIVGYNGLSPEEKSRMDLFAHLKINLTQSSL